jgi:hypothetical protein
MLPVGVGLGWLSSFIGQWFSLILLFPATIGAGAAAAVGCGLRLGKTDHPRLAIFLAVVGGVIGQLSVHYFDNARCAATELGHFEKRNAELRKELDRKVGRLTTEPLGPDETQEARDQLRAQLESYQRQPPPRPPVINQWRALEVRANDGVSIGIRSAPWIPLQGAGAYLL